MSARTYITELLKSPLTLAVAALLVGIAIVWDGAAARAMNGVGGVFRVACAVVMARSLRFDPRWRQRAALVLALALCFAVVVRPSDGLIAIVAFGLGGSAIATVSMPRAVAWSVLLPAIWSQYFKRDRLAFDASGNPRRTMEFLVDLNRRLSQEISYVIRMEPGVQTPRGDADAAPARAATRRGCWCRCCAISAWPRGSCPGT